MGKSTTSMAIFNSYQYVSLPEGNGKINKLIADHSRLNDVFSMELKKDLADWPDLCSHGSNKYIHPINSYMDIYPGGLFIEPAFSTFAVFVIDFIPQITVVLHLSQSSISLKSTHVLFTGYVKKTSAALSFFLR